MKAVVPIIVLICFQVNVYAQTYHTMYDSETLRHWNNRYASAVRFNFDSLVKPHVGCDRMELSLPALPSSKVDAFNFYAYNQSVILPTSAILFFDQLCIASSWLIENGYSTEVIFDYMGMLKNQRFEKYPQPLTALGIPENALSNPVVDKRAQGFLKSGILWIMAHEAGHICLDHASSTINNEIDADQYANNVFKKLGIVPAGVIPFFLAFANFSPQPGDFNSDADWKAYLENSATHPTSLERLDALAEDLTKHAHEFSKYPNDKASYQNVMAVALQLKQLLAILDAPNMIEFMRLRSLQITVADLVPRKLGDVTFIPRLTGRIDGFNGSYEGVWARFRNSERNEYAFATVELSVEGKSVTGKFNFGAGIGKITGRLVSDDRIDFAWTFGESYGRGTLLETSGSVYHLEGTWGYNEKIDAGGLWKLTKKPME